MRTVPRLIIAGLMLAAPMAVALSATPAPAADPPADTAAPPAAQPATPSEQARKGLELLMKALEGWIRQFPVYAAPEFTPDGDIIIRRLDKNRPATPDQPAPPPPGGAPT